MAEIRPLTPLQIVLSCRVAPKRAKNKRACFELNSVFGEFIFVLFFF